MKRLLITTLALFALAACDKPAETKPEDPASKNATTTTNGTATGTTAVTPTPVTVTIADGDLSTPADFEEAAEKSITAKTYKAELATLEADIAKE